MRTTITIMAFIALAVTLSLIGSNFIKEDDRTVSRGYFNWKVEGYSSMPKTAPSRVDGTGEQQNLQSTVAALPPLFVAGKEIVRTR